MRHPESKSLASLAFVALVSACVGPVPPASPADSPAILAPFTGHVDVAVRWPQARTQAIPWSTQAIVLTMRTPEGDSLASFLLTKKPDQAVATGSFVARAGQVTIEADAYESSSPTGPPIAMVSQGLTVRPNVDTPVTLRLVPRAIPYVLVGDKTAAGSLNGAIGGYLLLNGGNFGASRQTSIQVKVGGVPVAAAQRLNDTQIGVTVPVGATSGGIVVVSDGIPSATASFQLLQTLALVGPPATLSTQATLALRVTGTDDHGGPVALPNVAWVTNDLLPPSKTAALATVSASGVLTTGSATGTLLVTAFSGLTSATASIAIQ
jgi:hypothetical protein